MNDAQQAHVEKMRDDLLACLRRRMFGTWTAEYESDVEVFAIRRNGRDVCDVEMQTLIDDGAEHTSARVVAKADRSRKASTSSARATDATLYARARAKRAKGKPLSYKERQRLDVARDRRIAREEATAKKDNRRALNDQGGLRFRMSRYGWRLVIPNNHPGGPWSKGDELEVVTGPGARKWVTLVKLWFTGRDPYRSEWWSFMHGRASEMAPHAPSEPPPEPPPRELMLKPSALDDEDMDRVSTGAGAAYLAARRKRAEPT